MTEREILQHMKDSGLTYQQIADKLSEKVGVTINKGTILFILKNNQQPSLPIRKALGTFKVRIRSCIDWNNPQERDNFNRMLFHTGATHKQIIMDWMEKHEKYQNCDLYGDDNV